MSEPYVRTASERLLVWMSELGVGSWRRFKEACEWEFRHELNDEPPSPGLVAAHLTQRGYAEIDWLRRRWVVAPTVVTTVPGLPSAAIVVGGRTKSTLAYWESVDDPDVYLEPHAEADDSANRLQLAARHRVRTVFVISDEVASLERVADRMGAAFQWDSGPELSKRLRTLTEEILDAPRLPPPPECHVARYNPTAGSWQDVPAATQTGFYRFRPKRLIGPTQFRLISTVGAHEVDRSMGIYAELDRHRLGVLQYHPTDVNGFLYVRADAPLPTLHARALFLCSGLAPLEVTLQGVGTARQYVNVPRDVAQRVAAALNQPLGTAN